MPICGIRGSRMATNDEPAGLRPWRAVVVTHTAPGRNQQHCDICLPGLAKCSPRPTARLAPLLTERWAAERPQSTPSTPARARSRAPATSPRPSPVTRARWLYASGSTCSQRNKRPGGVRYRYPAGLTYSRSTCSTSSSNRATSVCSFPGATNERNHLHRPVLVCSPPPGGPAPHGSSSAGSFLLRIPCAAREQDVATMFVEFNAPSACHNGREAPASIAYFDLTTTKHIDH